MLREEIPNRAVFDDMLSEVAPEEVGRDKVAESCVRDAEVGALDVLLSLIEVLEARFELFLLIEERLAVLIAHSRETLRNGGGFFLHHHPPFRCSQT